MSEYPNPHTEFSMPGRVSDKSRDRTGTPYDRDYEHVGVDASYDGGLRPFPGFYQIRELTGNLGTGTYPQNLRGAWPISFRISNSEAAYGFVYRVSQVNGTCKIFLEYRKESSSTWYGPIDLVGTKTHGLKSMDLAVVGKFVWIFVEGEEPFFFYYDSTAASPFITVVTDTGAGASPEFTAEEKNIGWASEVNNDINASSVEANYVSTDVLCELGNPTGGAAAKLFIIEMNNDTGYWFQPLNGPGAYTKGDNVSIWPSGNAPQSNPSFDSVPSGTQSRYLWQTGLSGINASSDGTTAGEFRFCYQLFDSRTGRRSNFSDFLSRGIYLSGGTNGVGSQDAGRRPVGFPAIEIVYDRLKWDTLFIFRTVLDSTFYKLDNIITLEDYHVDTAYQPLDTQFKRSIYTYELTDAALAVVQSLADFNIFDEEMPTAGAAIFHEGSMLFGNLATIDNAKGGIGLVRYSDPTSVSPELVLPEAVYYLQHPTDEVIRFVHMGPNVAALSQQGIYLFRKQNTVVIGLPLHKGMGIVHERAATPVGSNVYFITPTSLKAMDSSGNLSNVEIVKSLIVRDWAGDHDRLRCAWDPYMNALILLKSEYALSVISSTSEAGQAAILWFDTNRLSELHDCPFSHVETGMVCETTLGTQERAVFFQEIYKVTGNVAFRALVVDCNHNKLISSSVTSALNGEQRTTMLPVTGDTLFTVITLAGTSLLVNSTLGTIGTNIEGATMYVVQSANPALVGKKFRALYRISSNTIAIRDQAEIAGIAAGDVVALSPVYFRYTSPPLSPVTSEGTQFLGNSFFRQRHVTAVGASFEDVDTNFNTTNYPLVAKYNALVWSGSSDTPEDRAWPLNLQARTATALASLVDGAGEVYASMGDGQGVRGPCLAVSVEVICPDTTFTLLGVKATGSVGDKDRRNMA